jgi:chemotaxis protein methyltransferase CheR
MRFRGEVVRRFGLKFDDIKLDHLADIVRSRAEASGRISPAWYVERLIASPSSSDEWRVLAEQLTVNETYFFRNADSFRAFSELVLPETIGKRAETRRIRILSAGCASGDEPYSIAMTIREVLPDFEAWDISVVGVDLSPAAIRKATEGRYTAWSLRSTPEPMQRRYFRTEGREFQLLPEIQRMVRFEERNLAHEDTRSDFWRAATFDIVWCRNVMMYFTSDVSRKVVQRLEKVVVPGGFLFLGHAENLRGLSQRFHLCHSHETFYYQRRNDDSSVSTEEEEVTCVVDSIPSVVDSSTSWFEAIERASARIAALTQSSSAQHLESSEPAPPLGTTNPAHSSTAKSLEKPRISGELESVLEATRQERFADALLLLSALSRETLMEPEALLLRAILSINGGELCAAEVACTELLAIDELNAGAHYVMALCKEHEGDLSEAANCDRTAIYLDSTFAMPHLHLGLMARRSGDVAGAQHELAQALSLLEHEDSSRLLMFGGGFSRQTLLNLCRSEIRASGGRR